MPSLWQDTLPDSLLLHIFSFLMSGDLGLAARVCKKWYRVALDDALWHCLAKWKWKIKGPRKPGSASWREEVKRMTWHVPSVCTETIYQHKDEVLDVSFSNRGDLFCTSSKDAHVILWQVGNPCSLLVDRNMNQGCMQWDLCQLSAFNSLDTLVLVCGTEQNLQLSDNIDHAVIVTVGVCSVFTVPEMRYVCSVRLEPPTLFSAWLTENMILGGLPCTETENTNFLVIYKVTDDMVKNSVRDICSLRYIHSIPFLKINGIRWHLMNLLVARAALPSNQNLLTSQSSNGSESSVVKCSSKCTEYEGQNVNTDLHANLHANGFNVIVRNLGSVVSGSDQVRDMESGVPSEMDKSSASDHTSAPVNSVCSNSTYNGQKDMCPNVENSTDNHQNDFIMDVQNHEQQNPDQVEKNIIGAESDDPHTAHFVMFVSGQHDEIHVHEVNEVRSREFKGVYQARADRSVDRPDHVLQYKDSYITGITLSKDNRLLYVNYREADADNPVNQPQDGVELAANDKIYSEVLKLGCVDLGTMSKVEGVMYQGHIGYSSFPAWYICLDVSDNFVASCSEDNSVYIWDRHYQQQLQRLAHGENPSLKPDDSELPETTVTNGVAFSPVDEETCISVCDSMLIKVWGSKNRIRSFKICQLDS